MLKSHNPYLKKILREVSFLLLAAVLGMLLTYATFSLCGEGFDDRLVMNSGDTYFVVSLYTLIGFWSTVSLYLVYALRFLIGRFKDVVVNVLFSIISIYCLVCLYNTLETVKKNIVEPGRTIYPPLSAPHQDRAGNLFYEIHPVLQYLFAGLVLATAFAVYQTAHKLVLRYRRHGR